jgi:hypothetical protein
MHQTPVLTVIQEPARRAEAQPRPIQQLKQLPEFRHADHPVAA